MPKTMLITGASRGLGRGLAEIYARAGWRVHAVARQAGDLEAVPGITAHELEITDRKAIATLRTRFAEERLDLLINNAGIWGPKAQDLGPMDAEAWLEAFRVNAMCPYYVAEALLDPLARGRGRVVTITSGMASITNNNSGGDYIYRSSKAAASMAMRSLSRDAVTRGLCVVTLDPGWVRTDMGGAEAPLSIEESVSAMHRTIEGLTSRDNGKFLNLYGNEVPW